MISLACSRKISEHSGCWSRAIIPISFGGIFQVRGRGANSPVIAVRHASLEAGRLITSVVGAPRFKIEKRPKPQSASSSDGAICAVCMSEGQMTQKLSPFVLPKEADEICLISDITRWRQEKVGRFPKRIKLDGKKVVWRRVDIEEWAADPEGWRKRHERSAG